MIIIIIIRKRKKVRITGLKPRNTPTSSREPRATKQQPAATNHRLTTNEGYLNYELWIKDYGIKLLSSYHCQWTKNFEQQTVGRQLLACQVLSSWLMERNNNLSLLLSSSSSSLLFSLSSLFPISLLYWKHAAYNQTILQKCQQPQTRPKRGLIWTKDSYIRVQQRPVRTEIWQFFE